MATLPDRTDTRRLSFKQPDPVLTADKRIELEAIEKRRGKPERSKAPPFKRSRLPDGAVFRIVFDADRVEWTGTLTIGAIVVEGRAGGAMTLLSVLDAKYRAIPVATAPQAEAVR